MQADHLKLPNSGTRTRERCGTNSELGNDVEAAQELQNVEEQGQELENVAE